MWCMNERWYYSMSEYTSERTLGELISFSTLSTTLDPEQQLKDGMVLPHGRGLARGGGRAEKVELDEHVPWACACGAWVVVWCAAAHVSRSQLLGFLLDHLYYLPLGHQEVGHN